MVNPTLCQSDFSPFFGAMRNVFASSGGGNHSSGKTFQEKGTKCLFNEERGGGGMHYSDAAGEKSDIRQVLSQSYRVLLWEKIRASRVHVYHHNALFWILSSNPAPSAPTSLFPPPLSLFSSPFDAGIRGGFNAPFFFPLPSSHGDFSSDISISLPNKREIFDARRIIGGISSGFWATFPSSKKVTNHDHNSIFYDVFSSHLDPFFLQVTILFFNEEIRSPKSFLGKEKECERFIGASSKTEDRRGRMNLSLVGTGVKIPPFTLATMVVSPPKKSS